jgi:hypothetical protein
VILLTRIKIRRNSGFPGAFPTKVLRGRSNRVSRCLLKKSRPRHSRKGFHTPISSSVAADRLTPAQHQTKMQLGGSISAEATPGSIPASPKSSFAPARGEVCLALPFHPASLSCFLVSLFTCFLVSLFPCFLVSLFPCFLVSLFPCFLVSLFPCLLLCLAGFLSAAHQQGDFPQGTGAEKYARPASLTSTKAKRPRRKPAGALF